MIKAASLFSQLLHHFPRTEFAQLVAKHQAERKAKGFTCWTQLVAMLFCHMARADSLREICGGLACYQGKLKHLGIGKAPNKSTISYGNKHHLAGLFEELFWTMMHRFRSSGGLANDLVTRPIWPTSYATGDPTQVTWFWTAGCRAKIKKGNLVLEKCFRN